MLPNLKLLLTKINFGLSFFTNNFLIKSIDFVFENCLPNFFTIAKSTSNLDRRFIGDYSGSSITPSELNELYLQIQTLIDEISNTIPGDINSDGVLNVVDVVSIVNLILAGEYNELADINDDNTLNVTDVISIINLILNN